jgi:hypothetical protein
MGRVDARPARPAACRGVRVRMWVGVLRARAGPQPFAIVPCCVFPNANTHRRLPGGAARPPRGARAAGRADGAGGAGWAGRAVRTLQELIDFIKSKARLPRCPAPPWQRPPRPRPTPHG